MGLLNTARFAEVFPGSLWINTYMDDLPSTSGSTRKPGKLID
jgi:hypothetical protein